MYTVGLMARITKKFRRSDNAIKGKIQRELKAENKGSDMQKVVSAFYDRYCATAKPTTNEDVLQEAMETASTCKKNKKQTKYEALQETLEKSNVQMMTCMNKLVEGFQTITTAVLESRSEVQESKVSETITQAATERKQESDAEKIFKEFKIALYAKHAGCSEGLMKDKLDNVRVELHNPLVKAAVIDELMWWHNGALDMESPDFWHMVISMVQRVSRK
jgi:hypothetical protein